MTAIPIRFPDYRLELPAWITDYLSKSSGQTNTPEQRMDLIIGLARMNIQHGTGGPFAAAVFRLDTHQLVAPGVNRVLPSRCSAAHAEMVALILAQQIVNSHDLGAEGLPPHELVTTCEPCTMCLGAICWSGVRQVVCGAREADATEIGFDEGPKPDNWMTELEQRGIRIIQDIKRQDARQILQDYALGQGTIYNSDIRRQAPSS